MYTGVRYVALSPNIVKVLMRSFVFGLTGIVVLALLPLVSKHLVQGNALVFGILLGAYGIGAVAGAAISRPIREKLSNEVLVRWSFIAFAVCAAVTGVSPSIWITSAVLSVGGAAWVIALSLFNTTVQMSTPRWVVGRALSLYQMAIFGGMALGSWLWGLVAEHFSLEISLLAAGASMLVGALIGVKVPLPSRETLNLDPINSWHEPQTALPIEPRSGPVAIVVEYLIDQRDVRGFLRLMVERRRARRRDGAHDWTLSQDLAHPELWLEHYEVPTWVDYVRFHSRTTQDDAAIALQLRALHKGEGPPRVRRMLEWKANPAQREQIRPTPDELL